MPPTPQWLRCLILCSLLLLAREGWTQQPKAAQKHFNKAETAYRLGRYNEAIAEYEAAYRALPESAFLFNIAQSYRLQYALDKTPRHLHKALYLYNTYIREMPKAPNRATVLQIVEELKTQLASIQAQMDRGALREQNTPDTTPGTLILRGETAQGAQVMLDDRPLGTMPLTTLVAPGPHRVEVKRPGFAVWSSTLNVPARGTTEVPVNLQRLPLVAPSASTPFYKTWWFWTIVGTAVVAGAGTGIYFGVRGERVPEMPQVDLR